MQKRNLKIMVSLAIIVVFVIGVLTYVSILGENDRINKMIGNYFSALQEGKYLEACDNFSSDFQGEHLATEDQRGTFNFLLELTLLEYFGLLDQNEYTSSVRRSDFWIPFIRDDVVVVSVALSAKKEKGVVSTRASQQRELLHNFIIVVREKGAWKIKRFNITGSAVAGIYTELRRNVNLAQYVQNISSDEFQLRDAHINLKTMTPLDKRLLRFSLYKIQKSIEPPRKKAGLSPFFK
jgi:hypothetical protein